MNYSSYHKINEGKILKKKTKKKPDPPQTTITMLVRECYQGRSSKTNIWALSWENLFSGFATR